MEKEILAKLGEESVLFDKNETANEIIRNFEDITSYVKKYLKEDETAVNRVYLVRHGYTVECADKGVKKKTKCADLTGYKSDYKSSGMKQMENVVEQLKLVGVNGENTHIWGDASARRIDESMLLIEQGLNIEEGNVDFQITQLDSIPELESEMSAKLKAGAIHEEFVSKKLHPFLQSTKNTHLILVLHKSSTSNLENKFAETMMKYETTYDHNYGEIREWDYNMEGGFIRKDANILQLTVNNYKAVRDELQEEPIFKHYFELFDKNGLQIFEQQNIINAVFRANNGLIEKMLDLKNADLIFFCIRNLISSCNLSLLYTSFFDFVNKFESFVLENFINYICSNVDDKNKEEFILMLYSDIRGTNLLKNIKFENLEVKNIVNYILNIKPSIDFLRKRSLDEKIYFGSAPTISVQFAENKYSDIESFLDQKGFIYIQGESGSGKSIKLLEILEYSYSINKYALYVNLGNFRFTDLLNKIVDMQSHCNADIILLDALDESKYSNDEKIELFGEIKKLSETTRIVMTSRPAHLPVFDTNEEKTKYMPEIDLLNVLPLTQEQILKYVKNRGDIKFIHNWEKISETEYLKGIESNPLILTMICNLLAEGVDYTMIKNKSDLYKLIIQKRLQVWEEAKLYNEKFTQVSMRVKTKFLLELAYMAFKDANFMKYENLNKLIESNDYYVLLFKLLKISEGVYEYDLNSLNLIFRLDNETNFQFVHESFKDYLVANYIVDNYKIPDDVNKRDGDDDIFHNLYTDYLIPILGHILIYARNNLNAALVDELLKYVLKEYVVYNRRKSGSLVPQLGTLPLDALKHILEYSDDNGNKLIDVNLEDSRNNTIFLTACECGNLDVIKHLVGGRHTLLNSRVDLNSMDYDDKSGFIKACENGHLLVVKYLYGLKDKNNKKLVDIYHKSNVGYDGFMRAVDKQNLTIMEFLFNNESEKKEKFKSLTNRTNLGENSFMKACSGGNLNVVKSLYEMALKSKINIDKFVKFGFHNACRFGNFDVIKFLCTLVDSKGKRLIDFNLKDDEGNTGFKKACGAGNLEIVKYLVSLKDKDNNYLINFNEKDDEGKTGIMYCADAYGKIHYDVLDFLINVKDDIGDHLIDLNIVDNNKDDFFKHMCKIGELEIIKKLCELKDKNGKYLVDLNKKGFLELSGLLEACFNGYLDVVKYLIEFSFNNQDVINIFEVDFLGSNLLYYAAQMGNVEIMNYLINLHDKNGKMLFDVNYQNNDLETCLIKACKEGHQDIVELLLSLRNNDGFMLIDPTLEDNEGNSAIKYANSEIKKKIAITMSKYHESSEIREEIKKVLAKHFNYKPGLRLLK